MWFRRSTRRNTPPRHSQLIFFSFDGTWAGGILNSRKTVVSELCNLISDREKVVPRNFDGVGVGVGMFRKLIGGMTGWGTRRNIITAYRALANLYRPGDRIVLCGYSRGAWAARYLALLIHVAGLPNPRDWDDSLYSRLYDVCRHDSIPTREVVAEIVGKHQVHRDVAIDALCCFDTVGSMGLPLFGLAKPLALFRGQRSDFISDVAPNVKHAFHCLALHENREAFNATLMSGPAVHQVFFPGTHSDMGWIDSHEDLSHAALAWMIQQLESSMNIRFDKKQLARRFPRYDTPCDPRRDPEWCQKLRWCNRPLCRTSRALLAIIGKEPRKPGFIAAVQIVSQNETASSRNSGSTLGRASEGAEIRIHIGARLRVAVDGARAVPGYALGGGERHWVQPRGGLGLEQIMEAPVGRLEAQLLGLPALGR